MVYLREPDLIESKSEKIKMSNEDFKEIVMQSYKEIDFDIAPDSMLLSPAGTVYHKDIMLNIFEEIFIYSKSRKRILYVKLHPAERYINEIKELIMKYKDNVIYIEDNKYTSEDFILNENITTIISDYSSTLINAHYLRSDIELLSYMYRLYEKYSVDLGLNISILEKLFNEGVIKRIEI